MALSAETEQCANEEKKKRKHLLAIARQLKVQRDALLLYSLFLLVFFSSSFLPFFLFNEFLLSLSLFSVEQSSRSAVLDGGRPQHQRKQLRTQRGPGEEQARSGHL
jgi:hypothetical protein